jgi:hypothetical protein
MAIPNAFTNPGVLFYIQLAMLYGKTGRPNFSVARMLGLCLLQGLYSLNDQQAFDAFGVKAPLRHEQAACAQIGQSEFCRCVQSNCLQHKTLGQMSIAPPID